MTNTQPSISVIIPSYNSGNFLSFCLQSICEQKYPSVEVFVVDNKSTDNTEIVVQKYSSLVTNFISESDEGQSDAVNKGFAQARGDFLVWQNADDVFMPNAFSAFARAYQRDKSHDVYFGDIALLSEDGRVLWTRYFSGVDSLIANYHGLICNNQSAFIKRGVIERFGFLDVSYHYAMDREFFLRLFRNGARFKHLDAVVSGFRHQPESKTETPENKAKWAVEHRRIAEQYGLYPPDSRMSVLLEKLGTVDKGLRMLAANPRRFAATVRRIFSGPVTKPY